MPNVIELLEKSSSLYADWIKNLAALSMVALTILVSLMPEILPGAPAKYFLATCWFLLALCIPCSLAASFRPIVEAKKLANAAMDIAKSNPGEREIKGSAESIRLHRLDAFLLKIQVIAVGTFCLSFIMLALYAITLLIC